MMQHPTHQQCHAVVRIRVHHVLAAGEPELAAEIEDATAAVGAGWPVCGGDVSNHVETAFLPSIMTHSALSRLGRRRNTLSYPMLSRRCCDGVSITSIATLSLPALKNES